MTGDQHHSGLDELSQRPQVLDGAAADSPRLRPYQGSPASVPQNGALPIAPEQAAPAYSAWHSAPATPPEPFYPASPYSAPPYSASPYSAPPQSAAQQNGNGYPSLGNEASATAAGVSTAPPSTGMDPFHAAAAASAADADSALASGLQRALNAVRSTIPLVQRLLPFFEGNIATAATALTALVAPQPTVQHIHHPPAPVPAPVLPPVKVDLEPIERGLAEVRTTHRELRTQVAEQTTAIKRFEDQLDHVREATDRNTLEQQELVEDLRTVGSRLSTFAIIGLILLVLSLLVNTFLIVQMQHILR